MSQKIGEREAQLRAMREASNKPVKTVRDLAAELPATSGKKPVKRKRAKR
jgi:hypothetical protein